MIYFANIHIFIIFAPMKTFARNIFSVLLIILYVIGFVGFGVHECRTEETINVLLMMGDVSCESIHDHSHDHNGCCEFHCVVHNSHFTDCSGNCCDTEVYVITSDQNSLQDEDLKLSAQNIVLPLSCDDLIADSFTSAAFPSRDLAPPKVGLLRSALSVWRL